MALLAFSHNCMRFFACALFLFVIILTTTSIVSNTFVVLIVHTSMRGALVLLLFAVLWTMMFMSLAGLALRDPGLVPPWMNIEKVEYFVMQEVQSIAGGGRDGGAKDQPDEVSASPPGKSRRQPRKEAAVAPMECTSVVVEGGRDEDDDPDGLVSANTVMSTTQMERRRKDDQVWRSAGAAEVDEWSGQDGEDATKSLPLDDPVVMAQRRERKKRYGLHLASVAEVAHGALRALHGDAQSKENEMKLLLHNAEACQLCSVYKLMDTHHCKRCGRCVYRMDHHCFFIAQCVGAGNHKFFVLFLLYLSSAALISIIATAYTVRQRYNFFFSPLFNKWGYFFSFLTHTLGFLSSAMLVQHVYDVGCGQTTLRQMQREDREMIEQLMSRSSEGTTYRPLFQEEMDAPPGPFRWSCVCTTIFGEGTRWHWMLPWQPVQRASLGEQESQFWVTVGTMVSQKLRAIADIADCESSHGDAAAAATPPPPLMGTRPKRVAFFSAPGAPPQPPMPHQRRPLDEGKGFLAVPAANVSASALSALVGALQEEVSVSAALRAMEESGLQSKFFGHLVSVANDSAKPTALRVMALECLYLVSHAASKGVRQGPLLDAVTELSESFETMMVRGGAELERQHLMLCIILLRSTGYDRLKAGDVLIQMLCRDDKRLVNLVLALLRDPTFEWPLRHTAARWLFELTTPTSYFDAAASNGETQEIDIFQKKLTALMEHCVECGALPAVCLELTSLWRGTCGLEGDAAATLGAVPGLHELTPIQATTLAQWAALLHYIAACVHNMTVFCSQQELVRGLRHGLLSQCQPFLDEVVVPFVVAALHAWARDNSSGSTEACGVADALLATAVELLRLLQLLLYKPPAETLLGSALLGALRTLTEHVTRLLPMLRKEHRGMLVLLLTTEALTNVNAKVVPALTEVFETLIRAIAADQTPFGPSRSIPTSRAFSLSLYAESSSYVDMQNESMALVHRLFGPTQEDSAAVLMEIIALERQMELLQLVILQVSLGQALEQLIAFEPLKSLTNPALITAGDHKDADTKAPSLSRKAKPHPPEYCCQLTRRLMREPVVLKNGHRFEYDALQKIIDEIGHVDPLTGEAINEEVSVDEALQQRISAYRVRRAALRQ